jgi:hypothetical protein
MTKLFLAIALVAMTACAAPSFAQCGYTGWNFTDQDNSGNQTDECNDTGNG